jgi:hypothetical protein
MPVGGTHQKHEETTALHTAPQQCALSNFPRGTAFAVEVPRSNDVPSIEFSRSRPVRYLNLPRVQDLAQRPSFASVEEIHEDTTAAIPKGDFQRRLQLCQNHRSKCVATRRTSLFRGWLECSSYTSFCYQYDSAQGTFDFMRKIGLSTNWLSKHSVTNGNNSCNTKFLSLAQLPQLVQQVALSWTVSPSGKVLVQ